MQVSDELARLFANMGRKLGRWPDSDLAAADAGVLFALAGQPDGMRLQDLAHLRGVDASTMSRRVAGLIDQELVSRRPHPTDGRAHVLTLTRQGRSELAKERARRVRLVTETLDGWEPDDLHQLASMLCRLNESLEATHE